MFSIFLYFKEFGYSVWKNYYAKDQFLKLIQLSTLF